MVPVISISVWTAYLLMLVGSSLASNQPPCVDSEPLVRLNSEYGNTGCMDPSQQVCGWLRDDNVGPPMEQHNICHMTWVDTRWLIDYCRDVSRNTITPLTQSERRHGQGHILVKRGTNTAVDMEKADDDERAYDASECVDYMRGSCSSLQVPCVDSDTHFYQCQGEGPGIDDGKDD